MLKCSQTVGGGLGDEEGTAFVEIADGLHLVFLRHDGHMLAHQTDALLDALIQQVVGIVGNGLRHCAGFHGRDEIVQGAFQSLHHGDIVVDGKNAAELTYEA